jgi:hypothetical protein
MTKSKSNATKPSAGAKKPPASAKSAGASSKSAGASSGKAPLVTKQPQSKQQAALQNGMFLYTDDAWSQAYFNSNDLHSVERELFG